LGIEVKDSMRMTRPAIGRRQKGFTLIEIMVVVVIIGLLAAIVAPNFIGQVDTAAINKAKQDIRGIETALNLFRLDNYRYPTTAEGLSALVSNPGGELADTWKQYLPRLPQDPWDQAYRYQSPGQHGEIDIFSYGRDRQEGGEGVDADIGNWDLD
jgi:general secretion pathway protein G